MADAGEDMGQGAVILDAALRADVVKTRAIGDVDFRHQIDARASGALLEQGQLGTRLHLHAVMQDRIATC